MAALEWMGYRYPLPPCGNDRRGQFDLAWILFSLIHSTTHILDTSRMVPIGRIWHQETTILFVWCQIWCLCVVPKNMQKKKGQTKFMA
jgi:hypothetical protein